MKLRSKARRLQGEKDRLQNMFRVGKELANPFEEYRRMLREQSLRDSEALVPPSLFSLTSYLFVSVILGRSDSMEARDSMSFILGMLGKTSVSWSTYLLAMYYARRFTVNCANGVGLGELTLPCIPVYISAIICADKFLYDATYSNKDWSDFTRIPLHDLNNHERNFLRIMNYNLSDDGFDLFITHLDASLMLRQVFQWGFPASYMDLLRITNLLSTPPSSTSVASLFSSLGFEQSGLVGGWGGPHDGVQRLKPLEIAKMVYVIVLRSLVIYVAAAATAVAIITLVAVQIASRTSTALIAYTTTSV
ncbi:hypothetical protein HDU67_009324 [Dinochytrium kinnereticum]|nr:hypothetical protein HDU67_009324 [Dinochytrium kinnereticum]